MLAERPIVSSLLLVAAAAALGMFATMRAHTPAPITVPVIVDIPPPPPDACPSNARELLHLDASAALLCAHRGSTTFIVASYMTTERWERAAIIEYGRVQMIDRPAMPGWTAEWMFIADVNGDGVSEAFVGCASEWGRHRTDIIELRSGSVRFDYFSE